MNDRIRELHAAGWSERRIAAAFGVTRHRVRAALEGAVLPTADEGATWVEMVRIRMYRARYRQGDEEQLALAELAYDAAEWLDARWDQEKDREWQLVDVRQMAGSLGYVLDGVINGSDPLVRLHERRARRLLAPAG